MTSPKYPLLALVVCSLLGTTSLSADTLVDWGHGDYVNGDVHLALPAPNNVDDGGGNFTAIYGYDASTPISPSSGYTAPAGQSSTFYGGSYVTAPSASLAPWAFAGLEKADGTSPTSSYLRYDNDNDQSKVFSGAAFTAFLKNDFLSGGNSQTDGFDATSSLSLTANQGGVGANYFALLNNGQWYLSAANSSSDLSLSGAALLSSSWAAWDPTGGANGRLAAYPDGADFTVLGSSFQDIEGVGIYTALQSLSGGSKINVAYNSLVLDASAVVVPEPATSALFLLSGLVMAVALFRHRNRALKSC